MIQGSPEHRERNAAILRKIAAFDESVRAWPQERCREWLANLAQKG